MSLGGNAFATREAIKTFWVAETPFVRAFRSVNA